MWYDFHGRNLKDAKGRKRALERICRDLGNPLLSRFSAKNFIDYRNNYKTAGANTLNHHLAYLSAVFKEMVRLGTIDTNPMFDGFGIIAFASLSPIVFVLTYGIMV